MPVTVHLGPGRLITPPVQPPVVTGTFVWNKSTDIPITQGGTYPLSPDLTNTTNLPAFYGYKGPYGALANRGLTLNRTTGDLTASSNATVGASTAHKFEAVTERRTDMHDYGKDGPNWHYASLLSQNRWVNQGGDWLDKNMTPQGGTAWGQFVVQTNDAVRSTYPLSADTIALIERFRTYGNHGFFIRNTSGGTSTSFFARWYSVEADRPVLSITTNVGTYSCPCICSVTVGEPEDAGYGSQRHPYGEFSNIGDVFRSRAVLRFNLSAVQGTITSATLSLTNKAVAAGPHPQTFSFFLCMPPRVIRRPASEVGGVVEGIASAGANDMALATHPSVLFYHNVAPVGRSAVDNDAEIHARYQLAAGTYDEQVAAGGHTYVQWPEYGFGAIHAFAYSPPWQRIISWRNSPELWSKPPERTVFFRWMIKIDPTIQNVDLGVKLCGLENYLHRNPEWDTPGSPYDSGWHCIIVHEATQSHYNWQHGESFPSVCHPRSYHYDHNHEGRDVLAYDERLPPGPWSFEGSNEHAYCVEVMFTSNTVSPTVLQDGIYKVWLDGVLIHTSTDMYMRHGQESTLAQTPFIHVYHGGATPWVPGTTSWYEIGGICMAREYIGPPKRIGGSSETPGAITAPTADLDINGSSLAGWGPAYQNPEFHGDGMRYAQTVQNPDGRMLEWFDANHSSNKNPGDGIAGRYAQFSASGPPTLGLYAPIEGDTAYPISTDNHPGFLLNWMPNGGWTDYWGHGLHVIGLDGTKIRYGGGAYFTVDEMYRWEGVPDVHIPSWFNPATVTNPTQNWQCFFGGSSGATEYRGGPPRMHVIKSNPNYPTDPRPLWMQVVEYFQYAPYTARYSPQIGDWIYWGGCSQDIHSGNPGGPYEPERFWRIHVPTLLLNPPQIVQEECPRMPMTGVTGYFSAIVADVPRRRIIYIGEAIWVMQIPANHATSGMQWYGPMYPTNANTWDVWKTVINTQSSGFNTYNGMRAIHRTEFGPFGQTFIISNAGASFTRLKWNN